MKIDSQLKYGLLGRVGSFWSEQTDEQTSDISRTLVYRSAVTDALQTLDQVATGLAGSSRHTVGKEKVVSFSADQVVYVGPDLFSKWQAELQVDGKNLTVVRYDDPRVQAVASITNGTRYLLGGDNKFLVYESATPSSLSVTEVTYYVPIDFDIYPMIILDAYSERTFVMGIDFVVGDGYLIFKESPTKLFQNGRMLLSSYVCKSENYKDYTLRQDHDDSQGHWIQELYRHSQSAYHFEKAIAEYAGLVVLRHKGRVTASQPIFGGHRYIIEGEGLVDVRYPHNPLIVGEEYPRGYIIDDSFRVFYKKPGTSSDWWLPAMAGRRASLDGILPGKGCWVSSNSITVDYTDIHSSGKVHTRIHYEGSGETKENAWSLLKHQESVTGVFLADSLGLSTATPAKQINLMQYMADFYGDKLLIIRLGGYTGNVERIRRINHFIQREKPIGAITLTLDI